MAKKVISKKTIYKELRRKRIIGPIIFFILALALAALGFIFATREIIDYIINNKLTTEYESATVMADIYNSKENKDEAFDLMNSFNRDFYIVDKDGELVCQRGIITAEEDNSYEVKLTAFRKSRKVLAYKDSELAVIYPEKNGDVGFSLKRFVKFVNDESEKYEEKEPIVAVDTQGNQFFVEYDEEDFDSMNFPIWLTEELEDGQGTLVFKAVVRLEEKDLIIFIVVMAVIAVVVFIIIISIFSRTISNIHRQRKVTNYFFTDTVTGGKNWMWFIIRGEQLFSKKRSLKKNYAIVNLVMMNYQNYCLCHSVPEGEKLLREVHQRLNDSIDKKEICAHGESSNFGLILEYEEAEQLKGRLKNIISKLEITDCGHKFNYRAGAKLIEKNVDASGKTIKRENFVLEDEYINACAATASISEADESGVAFFDDKLIEEEKWQDSVQEHQDKAVENEEFLVYYQPKYDPRTNKLTGAEALIRWESPELGFVSPGRFIPIFEKNGFITNIDHYMITHVARDQKKWLDAGYKCVPVSVNVSRAHFVEEDLAEQIRDMVDEAGTPHKYIEIELTESAFFDDKKAMITTINKLKSYGFAVSMDDFGSGYSSLNSLKDMPLDVLKLDAEFFRGDSADGRGEIVVSEAIKLAKSLHMRTVAEGVEIKDQVEFLAGEGCDMIQGYYYAKPMPAAEYEGRMAEEIHDTEEIARKMADAEAAEKSMADAEAAKKCNDDAEAAKKS